MSRSITYRPEIDGLRCIAVLAVLIYHLDSSWLPGGYLGVDIFFVISGFLITAILYRQMGKDSFSLKEFWVRRFRRLFPALVVMVGAVTIFAAFVVPDPERAALKMQAFGALASFENILLWQTTGGYWSTSSEQIPLLHCWSLSLEEQFYLIFPTTFFILYRYQRKRISLAILVLTILSFSLCLFATPSYQSASFYLLPTRMWELLLGSLLAMWQPSLQVQRFEDRIKIFRWGPWLGLLLVLSSLVWVGYDARFPGYMPLAVCLGTLILIRYADRGKVRDWLGSAPMTAIGRLSYSLYLWHWPVIVLVGYILVEPHPLLLLPIIAVFSLASYHGIEKPLRFGGMSTPKLALGVAAVSVFSSLPLWLIPNSPLVTSIGDIEEDASLTYGAQYETIDRLRYDRGGVRFGAEFDGETDLVLIGSSHARVLGEAVHEFAEKNDLTAISLAASGLCVSRDCPAPHAPDAVVINETRFDLVRKMEPKVTVVAGQWNQDFEREGFREALQQSLERLSKTSGEVIVLGQVPMLDLPESYEFAFRKYLVANHLSGESREFQFAENVIEANEIVQDCIQSMGVTNLRYLDTHDLFTEDDGSVSVIAGGRILYYDLNHLNDSGSRVLVNQKLGGMISLALNRGKSQPASSSLTYKPED